MRCKTTLHRLNNQFFHAKQIIFLRFLSQSLMSMRTLNCFVPAVKCALVVQEEDSIVAMCSLPVFIGHQARANIIHAALTALCL